MGDVSFAFSFGDVSTSASPIIDKISPELDKELDALFDLFGDGKWALSEQYDIFF